MWQSADGGLFVPLLMSLSGTGSELRASIMVLMRRAWVMTALLSAILFAETVPMAGAASDEAAIRSLVGQYMAARNDKNVEATRSLFMPDADQLVSSGEWRRGIDALTRGMMASSQKEAGTSSIAVEHIRFVEPDVAIVDGRYQTSSASTGAVRKMWTTLIVKRTQDGWRIAAIRNMLPAPPRSNKAH